MKIGIVTQARMTSTRLPGKVMLTVGGKSILSHHIERLNRAGYPTFVATTTNEADDVIVVESEAAGASSVHRGSEHDVLSRFHDVSVAEQLDVVVRVTSDCPLIDGELIRRGVDAFLHAGDNYAFVSNTLDRTFPRGLDFEVFSAIALSDAAEHATLASEREHVTPFLYAGHPRVSLHSVTTHPDSSRFRITLDTRADFDVIRALIEDHGAATASAQQIIQILEANPGLVALNADVIQKSLPGNPGV